MIISPRSMGLLLLGLALTSVSTASAKPKEKSGSTPPATESTGSGAPEPGAEAGTTEEKKPKKDTKKGKGDDDADAKLTPIEDCGVASMDGVFREAKDVQTKLEDQRVALKNARQNVKSALGVATNAPMSTAFEELKKTAGDKLEVALDGGTPKLKAKDAVPENVQTAIDAVNGLLDASKSTAETVVSLKENVTGLIDKSKEFPTQIVAEVKGNPLGAAKASTTVAANIKAIAAMGDQADKLVNISTRLVSDFTAAFGSGS